MSFIVLSATKTESGDGKESNCVIIVVMPTFRPELHAETAVRVLCAEEQGPARARGMHDLGVTAPRSRICAGAAGPGRQRAGGWRALLERPPGGGLAMTMWSVTMTKSGVSRLMRPYSLITASCNK